ncbi:MAG TPA: 4-hydroxythreonine-4-phosphate dehydrogenase PdxA [Candidatus Cybelea sp.]|jgi:4-hydroxythreonine-4-phosphate dehydrogenase|nr:4-hydroxythreonine-4-phosphate dehydrogenase PdxA [Candidatus Cybelea sp.]
MTGWIAISLGDVTGIGPEVTLKALAEEAEQDDTRYLLIGDSGYTGALCEQLGLSLALQPFSELSAEGRFFLHDPLAQPLAPSLKPGSSAAARAAVAWLADGAHRCLSHQTDALVTAPLNKAAIVQSGQPFIGQTEFLSQLAGTDHTIMMLLGHDDRGRWLRVALATTHLSLKLVAENLSAAKIGLAIELAAKACQDLGLSRHRVAVCGLNPHAGEQGEFGREEIDLIEPVVASMQKKGLDVLGPLPADTLFHHAFGGNYDAVVAMYHDQGLGPLKMVAFDNGVNWTLGLPFIRTSPDHGTAYDIAGQNRASASSMRAAIQLAKQLVRRGAQPILS